MHWVSLESTKSCLISTLTTYQATGDAAYVSKAPISEIHDAE